MVDEPVYVQKYAVMAGRHDMPIRGWNAFINSYPELSDALKVMVDLGGRTGWWAHVVNLNDGSIVKEIT